MRLSSSLDAEEEHVSDGTDEPTDERHAAAEVPACAVPATAVVPPVCLASAVEPIQARDTEQARQTGAMPSPCTPTSKAQLRHADWTEQPPAPATAVNRIDTSATPDVPFEVVTQASCAVAAPRRRPGGFFAQPENCM